MVDVIHEEAAELGNNYKRVFVGGISQGCCTALNAALSCDKVIGGVVGLSGHVLPAIIDQIEKDKKGTFDEKKKNLSIFAYHGKMDQII